jgi:hypothetical protein
VCGGFEPRNFFTARWHSSGGMIRLPAGVAPDGFKTSDPLLKPMVAANTSWGIVQAPMLETIAFGAFQPMNGPLMKL